MAKTFAIVGKLYSLDIDYQVHIEYKTVFYLYIEFACNLKKFQSYFKK